MRQHENEKSRVLGSLLNARSSNDVLRESDVGKVLLVGMLLVDDLSQVLTVDLHG